MSEKGNKSTKKVAKKPVKKPATKKSTKTTKVTKKPASVKNEGAKSPAIFGNLRQKTAVLVNRVTGKEKEELNRLNTLLSATALIYVVLGALTVLALKPFYGTSSVYYQTKDALAEDTNQWLLGIKDIATFDLRWLIFGLMVGSAILLVLVATKSRISYEKYLKKQTSPMRWIYVGASSAVLLSIVALAVGINDLAVIKMTEALIVATAVLGYISDRDNDGKNPKWFAFIGSLFTGVFAWLAIIGVLAGTIFFTTENLEWEKYALAGVALLGFTNFAVAQYRYISGKSKSFISYEKQILLADLFTKIAVFVILVIALHK